MNRFRLSLPLVLLAGLLWLPGGAGAKEEPEIPPGFVFIPGGKFMMGVESETPTDNSPMHEVVLDAYIISRMEVTNGEYEAFLAAKGYETREHWSEAGWKWLQEAKDRKAPSDWEALKKELGDQFPTHPVVGVSWFEAEAFAKFRKLRLPTEAEWERAARGTDGRLFPWGNVFENGLREKKPAEETGRTYPVGGNPADVSADGLYDLGGNVSEWTATTFGPYPGSKYESRYWGEDARRMLKVARGGSWRYIDDARVPVEQKCRATYRLIQNPPENGCSFIGFRLAR